MLTRRPGHNRRVDPLQGQLLLASPALRDPNFRRTVILVVHHDDEGAMGLVLNRSSEAEAPPILPDLAEALADPRVAVGGPVAPTSLLVLAEFAQPDEAGLLVFEDVGLFGEATEPEAAVRARLFAGYAGWTGGQLEAELEEGSWIVEPARVEDAFPPLGRDLWGDVLRRKGGAYALVATMPLDPSLN
jgi:putative transcriptional regulator